MLETIALSLLAIVAVTNVGAVLWFERRRYGFVWQVWRRFRPLMLLGTLAVLLLTVAVAIILMVNVPFMKYGWMSLFYAGGGNVLVQPGLAGANSDIVWVRWLPVAFVVLLTFVMPFLARVEEEMFREGATQWGDIFWRSAIFGPIHCLLGIPLAGGIALIICGLWYGYQYRRAFYRNVHRGVEAAEQEALMVAITYHTLWNTLVAALLLCVTVAAAVR